MTDLETLPAKPSALPESWIDKLFDRFATMYGKHWADQWAGIPLDRIKRTWAEDLAFASGEQMRKALDHCKTQCKFPPTCPEFVGLCKSFSAAYAQPALPDHRRAEMPPEIRAEIAKLFDPSKKRDPKDWARQVLAMEARGEYPHQCGVEMAKRALGLDGPRH
jgi:hypothetical protein